MWRRDESGQRPWRGRPCSGVWIHAPLGLQVETLIPAPAAPDKTHCASFPQKRQSLGGLCLCLRRENRWRWRFVFQQYHEHEIGPDANWAGTLGKDTTPPFIKRPCCANNGATLSTSSGRYNHTHFQMRKLGFRDLERWPTIPRSFRWGQL